MCQDKDISNKDKIVFEIIITKNNLKLTDPEQVDVNPPYTHTNHNPSILIVYTTENQNGNQYR